MADSRLILLDTFRDNNAQLITAADMRELINAVYGEKVSLEDVIDNLLSISTTQTLSSNQGRVLKLTTDTLQTTLNAQAVEITNVKSDVIDIQSDLVNLSGGVSGTFTSADGKAITVTNGIITSIV